MDKGLADIPPPRGDIIVRGFEQPAPDNGVLHTKMVIADGQRATVLGSPYSQRYFDDQRHQIDNPERGDTTSDIVHDVSIGLVGPVVGDLHETFRAYWNEDQTPGDQIPRSSPSRSPRPQTSGTDGVVKVQVVRTLSAGRFSFLDGTSEKGILESYLRAIGPATRFIYLENQYFTDAIIADALARALKDKPRLELIFLLNIKPDVMLYPGRQARLVKRIRDAAPDRVGIFTRWSYDHAHPRPWVAPIYLHAKTAVVDDTWATIGSANLDGLSLDHNLLLSWELGTVEHEQLAAGAVHDLAHGADRGAVDQLDREALQLVDVELVGIGDGDQLVGAHEQAGAAQRFRGRAVGNLDEPDEHPASGGGPPRR